jgi:hypothetical protein
MFVCMLIRQLGISGAARIGQDDGRFRQTGLLELFGVVPVLAATFLGKVGDIGGPAALIRGERRVPPTQRFPAQA